MWIVVVLTWLPSRFHSAHQFCFTPADQKEVNHPRSLCQVSCVRVWSVVAVLKLSFLADNYSRNFLLMPVRAEKFQYILLLGLGCLTVLAGRGILFSGIWQTDNQKSPGFILHITSDTIREVLDTGWLLGFFYRTQWNSVWTPPYTWKLYTLLILMKKLIHFLIKYHNTAL